MEKLDGLQRLDCNLADLADLKALVAVVFDEVVEAFAQRLENKAHVTHVAVALFRLVHESLF